MLLRKAHKNDTKTWIHRAKRIYRFDFESDGLKNIREG